MNCAYPNCRNRALRIPVIHIPTLRTSGESDVMVKTDKPTLMIGPPVCLVHQASYKIADWMGAADWEQIVDAARIHGVRLEHEVTIKFEPVGWTPDARYLEVER